MPDSKSTIPEIPTPMAEIVSMGISAAVQSWAIRFSVSFRRSVAVFLSVVLPRAALANRFPARSVKTAVWVSSESFTPTTRSASGTTSSATGGRPRLVSRAAPSTSLRKPSAINSAVSAVTEPGLTLRLRAMVARAIRPLARTCSKICWRSENASRPELRRIGP